MYLFSRKINLGSIEKDLSISEAEAQLVEQYSKNIQMQDLALFCQLSIKRIDDLRIIGDENLTLEMYVMQLVHLKNLDNTNEIINENNIQSEKKENLSGKKLDEKNLETNFIT